MSYEVLISEEVQKFLQSHDTKTTRIVKDKLRILEEYPYPGEGPGDKEKLPIKGRKRHRLHIGRRWTAYYSICENNKKVKIFDIVSIEKAHKEFGF